MNKTTTNEVWKRPSKDSYYISIAEQVARRSTCLKRAYGAVIVNNDEIVATGYNGSPRGFTNCCDEGVCKRAGAPRYTDYEKCESVHAEQNAIIHASRQQMAGATLYLACWDYEATTQQPTFDVAPEPCPLCMRMIKNAGIVRIVNYSGEVKL
jgi:dCMP deaminase